MAENLPLILTLLTAAAGGLILGGLFWRSKRSVLLGLLAGAAAGALGPQFFMLPLDYCPFVPENQMSFTVQAFDQPHSAALLAPPAVAEQVGITRLGPSIQFAVNSVLLLAVGLIVVGLLIGLVAAVWVLRWYSAGRPLRAQLAPLPGMFRSGWGTPWLLLLPTLVVLILFSYIPTTQTFALSTTRLTRGADARLVPECLDNFADLFGEGTYQVFSGGQVFASSTPYLNTFTTSFVMAFLIVVLAIAVSLLIALMAYQPIRGGRYYRALLVWPYALSPVAAGILFYFLFNPVVGLFNQPLQAAGLDWRTNTSMAVWTVVLVSVWNSLGFNILFYIAGLQNVPKDLLEAASIDGANAWQRFRRITLPMLSPITFFLLITNLTYAFFETFGVIDALFLGSGGPLGAANNMIFSIYDTAVRVRDIGAASAQSIILLVVVIALTVYQFRTTGRRVNYGV